MVGVAGIGWITRQAFGCVGRGERTSLSDDVGLDGPARTALFDRVPRNFGRLDRVSRLTIASVSLALRDAGCTASPERKQDIGIIGTGPSGSLSADLSYFRDYLECGRKLARGNLFIYTLPSSPLGEAAIHTGLLGPLLYLADKRASLSSVLGTAAEMLSLCEAEAMLAGRTDEEGSFYVLLQRGSESISGGFCDADQAYAIAERSASIDQLVEEFKAMKGKWVLS